MKNFTLIIISAFFAIQLSAQNKIDITAKYGLKSKAMSAVLHLQNSSAVEALFSMSHNNNKVVLTGLYEEFFPIGNSEKLYWFIGAGLHAGYNRIHTKEKFQELKFGEILETKTRDIITKEYLSGADVIGGVNYYIPALKMVVGIDIKPSVDFINKNSMMMEGNFKLGIAL